MDKLLNMVEGSRGDGLGVDWIVAELMERHDASQESIPDLPGAKY